MARLTPRRRLWAAVGILSGITVLTVGAWGLRSWAPFAHQRATSTWPKNVQPLVDFVQSETQLRFQHATRVRFVSDQKAFHALLPPRSQTDQALAKLHDDAAMGRALGFWSGNVDLGVATDSLREASKFASAYLSASDTMLVEATNGDTPLTPLQRADIVVTLAAVLDDQHFRVLQRLTRIHSTQTFEALVGVHVGETAWLRDRYVRRFGTADRTAYDAATQQRGAAFAAATTDVPPVFRAIRNESGLLGLAFVAALHAEQPDGVAAAFTTDTPTALDQLEMPTGKYAHRDTTEAVDPPPVPLHAHLLGHRQLGPLGVYLMLAAGLTPTEAVTASDGWGNDAVTVFRAGAQTCANGRIVADTTADADRIERGLNAWGRTRPTATGALIGRKGDTLLFSACDPGAAVREPIVSAGALDQFFGRADELNRQINSNGLPARSECVAVSAYARYLAHDLDGSIIDEISSNCDSSV